ncbi:MAG: heparinase II/III family protein [Armatimonadetes bacterium]|nr:heparinase II/III family protein [Armatimonadota bacterium]
MNAWALSLVVALSGLAAAQEVKPLVLSDCDSPAAWAGGSLDTTNLKQGAGGIRWDHGKDPGLSLRQCPTDWSAYDRLTFWLWSAKATGSRFMLLIYSDNPKTEGDDYYSASMQANFTGWKRFSFYLPHLGVNREPAGWNQINRFGFSASGWGNEPNPQTMLVLDDVQLIRGGAVVGPSLSEDELFESLDLTRPELAAVKAALAKDDKATARHALAAYYRARTNVKYFVGPGEKANPKPAKPDTARAERAMRHQLESIGIQHEFGAVIDWHFDKTAEPGTTRALNPEWTWQLNRHADWIALSRAYRDTGDEKYATEFVAQMTQWSRDCPVPEDSANGYRSAWRTIETGIRAAQIWPELWNRFLLSPAMTDDALMVFLRAYIDHARHLMAFHTSGNWLAMEANGLYHVGALFPEFRDAPAWRKTGADWTYAEMENQVYPDGIQIELASGYHHVSLGNFLGVFKIARLNNLELPADFLARLERMYDFDTLGSLPDRRLPAVQDGGYMGVQGALREAAELFPARLDFRWYATEGKEGAPPKQTSYGFPYAGYYFQRSGWESDARCLMFDGGPFGYGHQHEDKLEIIVHAYGKLLLLDPGVYTYERSKWRSYFCDSQSHNVVLVDGQPQRRAGRPREQYVVKQPLPHVWETAADHDYVEATYDEPFGGAVKLGVKHTRRVLFVKPDYWVMLDSLESVDGKPHSYDALFHFNYGKLALDGLRARTEYAESANLSVTAAPRAGLKLSMVEGREDPVQGWLIEGSSRAKPAPVGIYTWQGDRTSHLLTVLMPYRQGAVDPIARVEALGEDGLGATIVFGDGRSHQVRFSGGAPAELQLGAVHGKGRALWSNGTQSIAAGG